MSGAIDVLHPETPRRILIVASNPSVSTQTGFATSEERFADEFVGQKLQPFWIEDEAHKLENTNFVVNSMFKAFAIRDGHLITGQQQYSGAAAAGLVIEALGV